jgi:hypothetical protein
MAPPMNGGDLGPSCGTRILVAAPRWKKREVQPLVGREQSRDNHTPCPGLRLCTLILPRWRPSGLRSSSTAQSYAKC